MLMLAFHASTMAQKPVFTTATTLAVVCAQLLVANAMYPVTVEDKSATDKPATDKPAKYKPALR